MLPRTQLVCLAAAFALSPLSLLAAEQNISITVLTSFDYPNSVVTFPSEINDRGDIVGSYNDNVGQKGFVRFANGNFSPPIVPPFVTSGYSGANSINHARTICGFFLDPDLITSHSYFFSKGTYTQFDIEGTIFSSVVSLNNAGDFTGSYETDTTSSQGYVSTGGNITSFTIPGASFIFPGAINNLGEIAGVYDIGTETNNHGFLRDGLGNLEYPIDFPGALGPFGSVLRAINDRGLVVGSYFDTNSVEHGFLFKKPNTFLSFNYPQSSSTRLSGINNSGLVCGWYVDELSGIRHGFVARIR